MPAAAAGAATPTPTLDLTLAPLPSSPRPSASELTELFAASLALALSVPATIAPASLLPSLPPTPPCVAWAMARSAGQTTLYKAQHLSEPWLARVTTTALPYALVHAGLYSDKSATETATVLGEKDSNTILREWSVGEDYTLHEIKKVLHVQAFSRREFWQTIVFREWPAAEGRGRTFIVVSKPTELDEGKPSDEEGGVRGVYTCVEVVTEKLDEEGKETEVEIICAVTSDAGGSIPRWVQNMALPGQIMADNDAFLRHLEEKRQQEEIAVPGK